MTIRNVKELASIVQFGFGSVLLVMGLSLVGVGLTTPMGARNANSEPVPTNVNESPIIETTKEKPIEEVNLEA